MRRSEDSRGDRSGLWFGGGTAESVVQMIAGLSAALRRVRRSYGKSFLFGIRRLTPEGMSMWLSWVWRELNLRGWGFGLQAW